jgi:hypothetical protein
LFLFQVIVFIVVQLLQKFNDDGLDVIKTENLYNARPRERLFSVGLKNELKSQKDRVEASSFFFFRLKLLAK